MHDRMIYMDKWGNKSFVKVLVGGRGTTDFLVEADDGSHIETTMENIFDITTLDVMEDICK